MTGLLHVLSIGSQESSNVVHGALLSRPKCRLLIATCAWDLCTVLASERVDIATLHDTLSRGELRNCAEYIRRHWPNAKILLINSEAEVLDDQLHDQQTSPGLSSESLLGMIERLSTSNRRSGRRAMNQERKQR